MATVKADGLKWIKRGKSVTPYWVANEVDVKNGFAPKTMNLSHLEHDPERLIAQCNVLQTQMIMWRLGTRRNGGADYDGSVLSLINAYETHEESPYHTIKPGSLVPYRHYLGKMRGYLAHVRVDDISGLDIMRWHKDWSLNGKHLAAAQMCRAVLMAVLSFGVMLRAEGASHTLAIMRETNRKLPGPKSRKSIATADQVVALRAAAHAAGRPSRALAYALVFESTLRLWDVIGQWWPMDKGGMSDILDPVREKKWFGLRWENISPDLILSYTPSKTKDTTEKEVWYPLADAPMVVEELAHWPEEKRQGPVIVLETTRLPYLPLTFAEAWRADRTKAGVSDKVWARDLRASGITEGRASAVAVDDVAKVAGHNSRKMTDEVYDRTTIEAAERFAKGRKERRETKR